MFENSWLSRLEADRRRFVVKTVTTAGLLAVVASVGLLLPRLDIIWSVLLLVGIVGLGADAILD